MDDYDDIRKRLMDILAEKLGLDANDVPSGANFRNDMHLDSFDTVELVMAIEDAFEIVLQDEEVEQIQTTRELLELLYRKLGGDDGTGSTAKLKPRR